MSQGNLPTSGGYAGAAWQLTGGSLFNALAFLMERVVAGRAIAGLVEVKAVHGGTETAAPPTVDVQPLVSQVDGVGNPVPHGVVYGLPCFRLQGGNGAVVLDPVVGDIGQAIICDRDISNVKATGAEATPGSWRQNDWADGCYFGGFLNGAPTSYVAIKSTGIDIRTTGTLTIEASNMTLGADGTFSTNGDVVAGAGGADSVTLQGHKHGTGTAAAGTTTPTAGT